MVCRLPKVSAFILNRVIQVQGGVSEAFGGRADQHRVRKPEVLEGLRQRVPADGVSPFAAEAEQDGVSPGELQKSILALDKVIRMVQLKVERLDVERPNVDIE